MKPNTPQPKYEFELWINNVLVADISRIAINRNFSIRRNDAEELTFDMHVKAYERHCVEAGRDPEATLVPYLTDVRVKRNGQYLFGVQVVDVTYSFAEGGSLMVVKCTGFLDLFRDRYVTKSYNQVEATQIARDLLAETQATHGSFGVSNGGQQFDTGVQRDRNYFDQNVKDGIVNLTNLIDGKFDFRFTYDRQFETYEKIGSNRPSLKLTYPYNIQSMTIPRSALNTFNYIIGLGSGFGEETLRAEFGDNASRANYGTRMRIVTFNSVSQQSTLDQNTQAELAMRKDLLLLPKITVSGEFFDLGVAGIGDRIPVEVQGHPSLPLNDTYRIEQIEVGLDENDYEEIDLTLDNLDV